MSVIGIALVASLIWVARAILRIESGSNAPIRPPVGPVTAPPPQYDDTELRTLIQTLSAAVAEGIQNVDRNNRRIEAVVRRARKELAESGLEHGGLEAEVGELHALDGEGSQDGWLPQVPESVDVGASDNAPSGVPGFSVTQLAEFRARRA